MAFPTYQSTNGERRIIPVTIFGEGLKSYRFPFEGVDVPYATISDPPDDADFQPLVALCLRDLLEPSQCQPLVDGKPYYLNDQASGGGFTVRAIDRKNATATAPPRIYLRACFAGSEGEVGEPRWNGYIELPSWDSRGGLVVQYGGLLCAQVELWGCVQAAMSPDAVPQIRLTATMDRIRDVEQTITGQYVTTTPLP